MTSAHPQPHQAPHTPTPFDPHAASPSQVQAVAALITDGHAFAYPDDPPLIPEGVVEDLKHEPFEARKAQWVVWEGDWALARATLEVSLTQNTHLGHVRVLVSPGSRRQGLGRSLAAEVRAQARAWGAQTLAGWGSDRVPAGEAFARALGAAPAQTLRTSELPADAVDPGLLDAWCSREAGDPYRLHVWTGPVPEEDLDRVCQAMMIMNTAPRGDFDMDDWVLTPQALRAAEQELEAQGERRLLLAVEDTRTGELGNGELVGYTELFWHPERARLVYQGGTAVRPADRGRGLGQWLKAAALRELRTLVPPGARVRTSNAHENAAMLGINLALGFAPWAETTAWQVGVDGGEAVSRS